MALLKPFLASQHLILVAIHKRRTLWRQELRPLSAVPMLVDQAAFDGLQHPP